MKTSVVKLPGKNSGYCCKIYINGRHVATVADPERTTREGANEAARHWGRKYRKLLTHAN